MHTRLANLLGVAALAMHDRLIAGATAAADTSASGAAALVTLSTDPGLSVTELGRRIGLSQPAAARMVDRLEKQKLVTRASSWGGWVAVHPTELGKHAARSLLDSRGDALSGAITGFNEQERVQLEGLLSKLLTNLYRGVGDAELMCRLCDRHACQAEGAVCPVGQADRECQAHGAPE